MKRINKLWLLLLIPVAVFCVPGFFFAMATGTRLLSIFVGPINVWNTPVHDPLADDVAGGYKLAERSIAFVGYSGEYFSRSSTIVLRKDHTVTLVDVPSYDGFGDSVKCVFNTHGTWKTDTSTYGSELLINVEVSPPIKGISSCGPMGLSLMNLLGRHPPYRIWYVMGDPDSDTGLSYVRQR